MRSGPGRRRYNPRVSFQTLQDDPTRQPAPRRPPEDRHLWEFAWVRDLLWITGALALVWLAYLARSILVPVLVGLALAYVFNPVVTWIHRRWHWPRWAGTALVMAVALLVMANLAVLIVPSLVDQTGRLIQNAPRYAREAADRVDVDLDQLRDRVRGVIQRFQREAEEAVEPSSDTGSPNAADGVVTADEPDVPLPPLAAGRSNESSDGGSIPWQSIGQVLLRGVGVTYGVVSGVVGFATYLALALFVIAFCFFFFSWHFQAIVQWIASFVPADHYDHTAAIVGRMDRSLSAFIRGRLIQSLVLGLVLSIGWWLADVPYWLLLGMGCGFLNLIPYAAFIGWPLAVLLAWADAGASGGQAGVWSILVWPSVVYIVGQGLDGWVVEPLVQGKATALDPLSVLLAVLIGATLAGVLGMILAIPVAACGKILAQELLIPRLRGAKSIVKP